MDTYTTHFAPLPPYIRIANKVFIVRPHPKRLGEWGISCLPIHDISYVVSLREDLHVPRIGFMPDEHLHFVAPIENVFSTKDRARGFIKAKRDKLIRERETKIEKIRREIDHLHRLQDTHYD